MGDKLTPEQRHRNMAAIRSKNTKPELIVRRGLWRRGFRYRLNHRRLPGHPDLVLRKYRTCIFVNGCFWHGHGVILPFDDLPFDNLLTRQASGARVLSDDLEGIQGSACCKIPKTNRAFWVAKIRRNMVRDREQQRLLAEMGWHCITVWECELTPKRREATLDSLAFTLNRIFLQDHAAHADYPMGQERPYDRAAEEGPTDL